MEETELRWLGNPNAEEISSIRACMAWTRTAQDNERWALVWVAEHETAAHPFVTARVQRCAEVAADAWVRALTELLYAVVP